MRSHVVMGWQRWALALVAFAMPDGLRAADAAATVPATAPATRPRLVAVARILAEDSDDDSTTAVNKLCTIYDRFEARDTTLRAATDNFARTFHVNLAVAWPDIKAAGAVQTSAVSLTLRQVSADQILRSILGQAAPGKLEYRVAEGVVEVHSRDWFDRQMLLRLYDPIGLMEKGFYPDTTPAARGPALAELARKVVTPEAWSRAGTTCKFLDGQVALSAGIWSQYEMSGLLGDLRRPIKVPVSKSQVAANQRSGEPLDLPPRLRFTESAQHTRKQLATALDPPVESGPLGSLLDQVAHHGDINLVTDWVALAPLSITPDTAVTLTPTESAPATQTHPTVDATLKQILLAAAGNKEVPLHFGISAEGVVTLTGKDAGDAAAQIAVYDLRDVARRVLFEAPPKNKPSLHEVIGAMLTGLGKAGFSATATDPDRIAIVEEFEGLLVVRAAPRVHRMVAAHLATLAK